MLDYYDTILVVVAAVTVSGFLVGYLTAFPLEAGVAAGVLLATPFVYHGLFVNPPQPTDDPRQAISAVAWHLVLLTTILLTIGVV